MKKTLVTLFATPVIIASFFGCTQKTDPKPSIQSATLSNNSGIVHNNLMDKIYEASYTAPQERCNDVQFVENVYTVMQENLSYYNDLKEEASIIRTDLPDFLAANITDSIIDTASLRVNLLTQFKDGMPNLDIVLATIAYTYYDETAFRAKTDSLLAVIDKNTAGTGSGYETAISVISVAQSSYSYWAANLSKWGTKEPKGNPGGRVQGKPTSAARKVGYVVVVDALSAAYGAASTAASGPGMVGGAVLGAVFGSAIAGAGFML